MRYFSNPWGGKDIPYPIEEDDSPPHQFVNTKKFSSIKKKKRKKNGTKHR